MKSYKIVSALFVAAALTGCSQKLPYDLDGVEKGVVINIHKPLGAAAAMQQDKSDVFDVILDIPWQQGDWSMLDKAFLTAVYTHNGEKTSADLDETVTEFPCTLKVKISDVCAKLGVSGDLSVGDRIEFTPSYTLKSGTTVKGWTSLIGFNNTPFSGWEMEDGSSYSYRIAYTAFAPFDKADFIGTGTLDDGYDTQVTITEISEKPDAKWIPAGVAEDKLIGLQLDGDIWYGGDRIKVWINTLDYTLIVPDQVICTGFTYGTYGTYDGEIADGDGEIDTLNKTITFYLYSVWGPYSLGDATLTISGIK